MVVVFDRENMFVLIGKGFYQSYVYVVCYLNSGSNDEVIKLRYYLRKLKIVIKYLFIFFLNLLEDF